MLHRTSRVKFLAFLAKYELLVSALKEFYAKLVADKVPNHGHALDHDLLVAAYCLQIAPDCDERVSELAAIAGLLHSMDRHFKTEKDGQDKIEGFISLLPDSITPSDLAGIQDAVAEHSKRNSDSDTMITMILKDSDRLANSGSLNTGRGGQHRPNVPAVELDYVFEPNPESTFKNITSLYDAWRYNMEWVPWLRLPKAIAIAKEDYSFGFTQLAIDMAQKQLVEAGLIDEESEKSK